MRNWFFDNYVGLREVFIQTAYREVRSLAFLHCLVKRLKPKVVLELGTGKGCSTAFMGLAIGDGLVVSIDNYQRPDINTPELVRQNLDTCGVLDKVELVRGSTFDVQKLPYRPELVFMDASHTADNLRREYDALEGILPQEHVIVADDALYNDIGDFLSVLMRENKYAFNLMLPFHQGMAVLATGFGLLPTVAAAVDDCLKLLEG